MTSDTHNTGRKIDGNVGLVSVDLTSVNVPSAQHRLVSAPVLMIQSSITDVYVVKARMAKVNITVHYIESYLESPIVKIQARKTTHGLDRQHQDVDRTLCGRVNQNDRG